jgi:bifunctional UDP-N-acetylglucosamine pyrophosphorylase/glucosamine-1-phosphate N-acetyltransferase
MRNAIVLAAGKGTRMKSSLSKVMHPILSKPMIGHVVTNLKQIDVEEIVVVIGHQADQVRDYLKDSVDYAVQMPQLGTGHAVMQVSGLRDKEGETLILYGDCPCITPETMEKIFVHNSDCAMTVLTAELDDPQKYGRVVRDEEGNIEKIVEFKDCTPRQLAIKEINTGIYCVKTHQLFKHLDEITNDNNQNEYYLTDLIEIFNAHGLSVQALPVDDVDEVMGVNDRFDLLAAQTWMQKRINLYWLSNGVTFVDPDLTFISPDSEIGEDTILYPNVYLEGKTTIGTGCTILPQTFLVNATIGNNVKIDASRISDSIVKDNVNIGPFAHLRMHCVVEDNNRIGNFVEMKNTTIGFDSRCAHLTYLGDAEIGSKVNIGCGVVTVNYDGKNKFKTTVKDGAFIGSNVNLIAPITIGENAVVAAGTTATKDVEEGDMAIARARQENKPGYGLKYKQKKKEGENHG